MKKLLCVVLIIFTILSLTESRRKRKNQISEENLSQTGNSQVIHEDGTMETTDKVKAVVKVTKPKDPGSTSDENSGSNNHDSEVINSVEATASSNTSPTNADTSSGDSDSENSNSSNSNEPGAKNPKAAKANSEDSTSSVDINTSSETTSETSSVNTRNTSSTVGDQLEPPNNIDTPTKVHVADGEEVGPLDIFVGGTSLQNFPVPMRLKTFKEKVLDRKYKKLYILEESDVRLFGQVRQLEANYFMKDDDLHVSFLFRFIFSRKCGEIKDYRLGKLVGKHYATFEKELKDGKTERLFFFSERPEDYLFLMSCKDMKSSARACHDNYYVSLGSSHDPPNQFPWYHAAHEMKSQLNISFEDPRFIFNFVMTPCVRPSS